MGVGRAFCITVFWGWDDEKVMMGGVVRVKCK